MKTQLSKASDGLAKYNADYRQQALEHWGARGGSGFVVCRRWADCGALSE